MKKTIILALISLCATIALLITYKESAPVEVDYDLARSSSTMAYAQVFNILVEPEKYDGKKIRVHGKFAVYEYKENGEERRDYACLVSDPTACCDQAIEFTLKDDVFPDNYPKEEESFTVSGIFRIHQKNGYDCAELVDAVIE